MKKIKKAILALGLILLTTTVAFAQAEDTSSSGNASKFVYCQMVGMQKFLSPKVTITLDFGEAKNIWKDNRVKDEVTGKAQSFYSMVDALNYMGEQGWEFAQAYVVTIGQQNVYHWLLKKKKDE
jgi:hypothetical protein